MKQWVNGILMLGGLVGCSAQVEPDYRGEPLAVLRGALVTGEQAAPSEVDAALVWLTADEIDGGWPIARVRVRGEFPAQFSIEVFDPPPAHAVRVVEGDVASPALDPTTIGILAAIAPNSGDSISYDEILGVWLGGAVEYFEHDAGGERVDYVQLEAERHKIAPTQGYHLYRQTSDEQLERASFRCEHLDLCAHDIYTDTPGAGRRGADLQHFLDTEYAKCQQYLDQPATCTTYYPTEGRSAEELAENARCQQLQQAREERKIAAPGFEGCSAPWEFVENPEGFDFPISIELGTTLVDMMNPRYRP
ncbi:MAG TPA: hypothetical protein VJU61_22700 [Polyangiaceae bacterium]|nr:hypothetical protein [Polyangiaceae bacterium]